MMSIRRQEQERRGFEKWQKNVWHMDREYKILYLNAFWMKRS